MPRYALLFTASLGLSFLPAPARAAAPNITCPRASDYGVEHPRTQPRLKTAHLAYGDKLEVRMAIQEPARGPIQGDVLYIHGFSDRLDNHGPLFDAWNERGLRVIAFDLPGHGEDSGDRNNINDWSFRQLADIARQVVGCAPANRPLVLAGWSTGGLLAVRMVEEKSRFPKLARKPAGVILYAPGVAIRKVRWDHGIRLVGDNGRVTESSLTSAQCPPHEGRIYPDELLTQVGFGIRLLTQAFESRRDRIPGDIPVLAFVAGEHEDVYADTPKVVRWIQSQRSRGSDMKAIRCEGSRHELDNEVPAISNPVRAASAEFAAAVVGHKRPVLAGSGPCKTF